MNQNYNKILKEGLTHISNLLKEEYSISDKVKYDATRITKEIKTGIVKGKKYEIILSENPYITFRYGTINSSVYGKPLTITKSVIYRNLKNQMFLRMLHQKNNK